MFLSRVVAVATVVSLCEIRGHHELGIDARRAFK